MNGCRNALAVLLLTAGLGAAPAAAEEAIVSYKALTPEAAVEMAQAALAACRKAGFQVAVSVVDRGGNLQASIRDRFAGPHTPDTSYRKAWTSVSFKTSTLELATLAESGPAWAIRGVSNALPLGGGLQVESGDGSLLGAIGVSGAPSGQLDTDCARTGIQAIEDKIAF